MPHTSILIVKEYFKNLSQINFWQKAVTEMHCSLVIALRQADPSSKESYQLCIGLRNWKSGQRVRERERECENGWEGVTLMTETVLVMTEYIVSRTSLSGGSCGI
jgi:hypothetical protein